jgi:hypothetical protein
MTTLTTPFRSILNGLKAVIAQIASKDRPRAIFLITIHTHLNRTIQRFEKLVAHWRANTLPKQRHRPNQTPRPNTTPRLPSGHAWMLRHVDHSDFRAYASQLNHFLTTPDAAKLLAEVPRAARILRPLSRALGLHFPGDPPPRPPKPPPVPKPPLNPWLALPPALPPIGIVVLRPLDLPIPPAFSKRR